MLGWKGKEIILGEFQVVVYPQLADQSITQVQSIAQEFFLLPVRLGEMLAAIDDFARALGTFSHAAAVGQVWIRKLPDPGSDDQICVFLDLTLMDLAVFVNDNCGHVGCPAAN